MENEEKTAVCGEELGNGNLTSEQLEKVAGGVDMYGWATVWGLQSGYLALRTSPGYDFLGIQPKNRQIRLDKRLFSILIGNNRSGEAGYRLAVLFPFLLFSKKRAFL